MHPMLLDATVRQCREYINAGDCHGAPPPTERLIEAVVQLALDRANAGERESEGVQPLNGIAATLRHDEGAIAQCFYCRRYTLDPKALSDRQPRCECGKTEGWSGSFKKPGPDAKWSGKVPAADPERREGAEGVAIPHGAKNG